ncbi:hypothetical protein SEUCBS140593_010023 [Sporothrix eucalyptigena]|uniref:Kinase n=1 Tax=Sporothrix eucalyptigena TaxID=1812306 RepID=A0ABP0D277_9PEZI
MATKRDLPHPSELREFGEAVAGHAGTLIDADGCLFIKPCVQAEIDFYAQVNDGSHPALADIMPLYMGSLSLNETSAAPVDGVGAVPPEAQQVISEFVQQQQQPTPVAPAAPVDDVTWVPRGSQGIKTDRAVVLDNATHGFVKPNVLDVKLGRRLWGDAAPLQKRQRMDEVSKQTTHNKYGFRIAGMRVYEGPDKGYRMYDKDFGRKEVNDDNVVDAFRQFLCNTSAGVDAEHSQAIALAFKSDLERVRDVLESERTRMYSSSLLFVYEGDGAALKTAVAQGNAQAEEEEIMVRVIEAEAECEEPGLTDDVDEATLRARSRRMGKAADRSSSRTDSGIVIDDDDLVEEVPGQANSVDDEAFGDDDSDDESSMPHIYCLRLIDFAHAKFVAPEDGPDENNLPGVRSLIDIFHELSK